jgi:actin-related protein
MTISRYLLIDSRPRRVVVVLPSSIPTPLMSATLDTLFIRFQPPTISLLSPPITTSAAAGVRSALVVDLGWNETIVTAVYEYREVHCSRTIRAGRMLVEEMHKLLRRSTSTDTDDSKEHFISFEECEDITSRMAWCKPADGRAKPQAKNEGLPTVQEQDEADVRSVHITDGSDTISFPLKSSYPPTTVQLPHQQLAEPCENAFFSLHKPHAEFDDEEMPLHLLVYRALLHLRTDVRSICMSRIIFTGGGSRVLGLRGRIFDEVSRLVKDRGWDPVVGEAVNKFKAKQKLRRQKSRQALRGGPSTAPQANDDDDDLDGVWHDAANAGPEADPVEEQLRKKQNDIPKQTHGELRAIDSLGAWSGASLLTHLKVPAIAAIDRELWIQHGASGASRPVEVDFKAQQRQSMGPGGLLRNAAAGSNWTLGVWGST